MKKITLLLLCLLLFVPQYALCNPCNPFYFGIAPTIALEDFKSFPDRHKTLDSAESWGTEIRIGYKFDHYNSIEIDLDPLLGFHGKQTTQYKGQEVKMKTDAQAVTFMPAIRSEVGEGSLKNYFIFGIGYMWFRYKTKYKTKVDPELFPDTDFAKSDIGSRIGLGLEYFFDRNENIALDLSGNYFWGMKGDLKDIKYWNFVGGLNYYFQLLK